jgi:uncharacterized membrane protein
MITLAVVYVLTGTLFLVFAVLSARDAANPKRWTTALFWGLFALSFLAGDYLTDVGNGVLVLSMAMIAGFGGLGIGKVATTTPEERKASAAKWGNRLFLPAIVIPLVTLFGTLAIKGFALGPIAFEGITFNGAPPIDPKQATLISLAAGAIIAAALAVLLLRQPVASPVQEGRRLMDIIGWAALLPQMLASLGAVFAVAGVGKVVGDLATQWVPGDSLIAAVAVYCVGMALFTMIMGNAFAAFPVLTAGIGIPFLIHHFNGDPAVVAAIGMLAGFCGTLMTPLAANFNIVPAALLELKNRNGVIVAQIPTALMMLAINTALMYLLAFPRP